MKCPKCGYLGFETTDRCRNCQYDFSLAPFLSEQDLILNSSDRKSESPLELPILRQSDAPASALDLDRLFGEPTPPTAAATPPVERQVTKPADAMRDFKELEHCSAEAFEDREKSVAGLATPRPGSVPATDAFAETRPGATEIDEGALPFDDAPIMAPPAARTPLAVRRSTPEMPRNRPRAPRPSRPAPLDFEQTDAQSPAVSRAAAETIASLLHSPSLGARIAAGLIDRLLLAGIYAAVLYLTLRITGLQNTVEDIRVLPVIPFMGFLAFLGFGYVAAFTVAGGQTIGKMILSLRVIGDDGRPIDAAGGMLRALATMLVPVTLGLSYVPVLFSSDHRALHDRLAGTRVVQE